MENCNLERKAAIELAIQKAHYIITYPKLRGNVEFYLPALNQHTLSCPLCSLYRALSFCKCNCPLNIEGKTCCDKDHPYNYFSDLRVFFRTSDHFIAPIEDILSRLLSIYIKEFING
jgi:hypothetical protein